MASPACVQPESGKPAAPVPEVTLLVCLPSRWKEFPGNLRASLQPGGAPLPIEREIGSIRPRWLSTSAAAHVLSAIALIWLVPKLPLDLPVVLDNTSRNFTTIYYQAPSLPQMEDAGASPRSSRSFHGQEAFHPTQTIHISRGSVIRPKVVDAPDPALPRVKGATANLLSITQLPLPSVPQLQTQPVELPKVQSKIARPATLAAPQPAADLARLRNTARSLPRLPTTSASSQLPLPSLPELQAQPVELQKVQSKIVRPANQTGPQPAADLSRLKNTARSLPRLPAASASAVRNPTPKPSPTEANQTGSTKELPSVVVSTQPGDMVAVPADGAPGSLAMSPQGRKQSGSGGEAGTASSARGPDPAAGLSEKTPPGKGPSDNSSSAAVAHAESASGPAAGPGISPAGGSGAAATGAPNLSPGVTVRGDVVSLDRFATNTSAPQTGVISLDSFGPKVPASRSNSPESSTTNPPRKPAPIVVVATGRSGGGLNAYGTFKSHTVYTIYFQTAAGTVTLQFAEHAPSSIYKGELTPPDAWSTDVPAPHGGSGVVLSCLLDATGHLRDIRVVEGAGPYSQTVVEAVRTWRFHPALSAGQPVALDALIGIGTSMR